MLTRGMGVVSSMLLLVLWVLSLMLASPSSGASAAYLDFCLSLFVCFLILRSLALVVIVSDQDTRAGCRGHIVGGGGRHLQGQAQAGPQPPTSYGP